MSNDGLTFANDARSIARCFSCPDCEADAYVNCEGRPGQPRTATEVCRARLEKALAEIKTRKDSL